MVGQGGSLQILTGATKDGTLRNQRGRPRGAAPTGERQRDATVGVWARSEDWIPACAGITVRGVNDKGGNDNKTMRANDYSPLRRRKGRKTEGEKEAQGGWGTPPLPWRACLAAVGKEDGGRDRKT
jgi:hypothetical protein